MTNIFGTDGIRGEVGATITPSLAYKLGTGLAESENLIVIGRDTRLSGSMLLSALVQGIYDFGGNVINIGIMPTNAVSHFVRKFNASYGVMISASHNPPNYNGFKVFDRYGVKLCSSQEQALSNKIQGLKMYYPKQMIEVKVFDNIEEIYINDLLGKLNVDLDGMSIALDCCYGSSFSVSPKLFNQANAKVKAYCYFNRGEKINVDCGATCPNFLQGQIDTNTDLAFAFDGDADRLTVFEKDKLIDNNAVFYAYAKYYKYKGLLKDNAVVGTVLTNGGLEHSLNKLGVSVYRSAVGDSKMFELMSKEGIVIAGEESGHYLFSQYFTTADALFNALLICKIYKEVGSILAYTKELVCLPSQDLSIPISPSSQEKIKQNLIPSLINKVETMYPQARLILRPSGTEPKLRAHVECDEITCKQVLGYILQQTEQFLSLLDYS
ncbi:MAG: hypothetical protein RR248_00030 [Clostridia bacterium]